MGSARCQVCQCYHTVKREVRQLLELLGEVVSLPSLPPVKFAIALDWYKTPVDDVDPLTGQIQR